MKKLLLLILIGLGLVSCSQAQNGDNQKMKEYKAKEIIKMINKGENVLIANAIIKDDVDFTNVDDVDIASPALFTANVSCSIYFQSCVFLGSVKSKGYQEINKKRIPVRTRFSKEVNFMDCDFRNEVDFCDAEFQSSVHFNKSVFRGEAKFNNILSMGNKNQWWEIEADSTFSMCGSTFRGDLNMMDAKFNRDASLQGINVRNLQISNLSSAEILDLSNVNINGSLLFNYGNCEENVLLSFGKFDGRTDIIGTTFNGTCEMEKSLFYGRVKMERSVFKKGINTDDTHFLLLPQTDGASFANDSIPTFNGFNINK